MVFNKKVNNRLFSLLLLSLFYVMTSSLSFATDKALIAGLEQATQGKVGVSTHSGTGKVRFLSAPQSGVISQPLVVAPDADTETAARGFLGVYGSLFGITSPDQELILKKARGRVVKFRQVYNGIPVIGGELVVNLGLKQNIRSINGEVSPDINISTTPAFGARKAKTKALALVSKKYGIAGSDLSVTDRELSVFNPVLIGLNDSNTNYLVWRFEVKSRDGLIREFVLIDAMTGMTRLSFNQVDSAKNRTIYDNYNDPNYGLPGYGPVRTEGGAATAQDASFAYDFLGDTYDFYWNVLGRDSIDGAGMDLIATVRYCDPSLPSKYCPYRNAFWNGEQMVFGQGFVADDVVAHELTHGVTEYESGLLYFSQSGAINESLSDMWGEFIDLTNGRGSDTPATKWLMGEDIPAIGAIRSMKNPSQFNDPDSMLSSRYYCKPNDQGGVHTNSGVNNKAAYLMTDGGFFNGYAVTGLGITKVAQLYYQVQTNHLTPGSDYQDLADSLLQSCDELTLSGVFQAYDCSEVEKALKAVHMFSMPAKCKAPDLPLCSDGSPNMPMIFSDDLENPSSGNWLTSFVSGSQQEWYYPQNPNPQGLDATNSPTPGSLYNFWGYAVDGIGDYAIAMTADKLIPSNAYMTFDHTYMFEAGAYGGTTFYFDGGVLEYSANNGTWTDAGNLIIVNGYDGYLYNYYSNPLRGRKAFSGSSNFLKTKLDLSSLAGQSVRFRFRIGTDRSTDNFGWFIDNIDIYTCSAPSPMTMAFSSSPDGQVLKNGEAVTLRWKGPANLAYANLLYTVDGRTWKKIDSNVSGNSYDWVLPLQANNRTKVRVKVIGYNDKGAAIGSATSGFFTIQVVTITSPNGTESWDEGTTQTITWVANTTKYPVSKVLLSYSTDNGITWKPIPADNINDGSYPWTLPLVKGDKTKSLVKIVLKDMNGNTVGSDISDTVFTVNKP